MNSSSPEWASSHNCPGLRQVRWGLIAGNGQFPFLVLEAARGQAIDMAVIAIREEASPELEKIAPQLHWVSLGELSRTLETMHEEGVTRAVMAGQVKHNKIFSSIRPDWKLAKLLLSLPLKNTDSLIGAVARVLESEGIVLVDSTTFLKPLIPAPGVLTRRAPDAREAADIAYGREIARQIAGIDLGQTVVIRDRACVALEAMEGTDETIERAARIAGDGSLVVVKVSKPKQDMRFDVPVVGLKTVEVMQRCRVTALGMDAGRTLLFDRARVIEVADAAGIAIEAFPQEDVGVTERPAVLGKSNNVSGEFSRETGTKKSVLPLLARGISAAITPACIASLPMLNLSVSWTRFPSAPRRSPRNFPPRPFLTSNRWPAAWTPPASLCRLSRTLALAAAFSNSAWTCWLKSRWPRLWPKPTNVAFRRGARRCAFCRSDTSSDLIPELLR